MRSWPLPATTTCRCSVILLIAAFLTAFYMGRQVLLVFFGKARTQRRRSTPRKARP